MGCILPSVAVSQYDYDRLTAACNREFEVRLVNALLAQDIPPDTDEFWLQIDVPFFRHGGVVVNFRNMKYRWGLFQKCGGDSVMRAPGSTGMPVMVDTCSFYFKGKSRLELGDEFSNLIFTAVAEHLICDRGLTCHKTDPKPNGEKDAFSHCDSCQKTFLSHNIRDVAADSGLPQFKTLCVCPSCRHLLARLLSRGTGFSINPESGMTFKCNDCGSDVFRPTGGGLVVDGLPLCGHCADARYAKKERERLAETQTEKKP